MNPYKFNYKNLDGLKKAVSELNIGLGLSENYGVLAQKVEIEDKLTLENALAVHPMEAFDAGDGGGPGELTLRRYKRFAESGAGLIWFEAVAVQNDALTAPRQLMITEKNLDEYKKLVETVKKTAGDKTKIVIQLTHSGRFSKPNPVIAAHNAALNTRMNLDPSYPCVSDDYLKRVEDNFETAAVLSHKAGFDIIDIKACHRYLFAELLGAFNRGGEYGGSYENRTRIFKNCIKRVKDRLNITIASRLGISDVIPYPDGFGTTADGEVDLTESLRLVGEINKLGVNLINITMGTPYYNPHINRPYNLNAGGTVSPSHPLVNLSNFIKYTAEIQRNYPQIACVGTGYSYLRGFAVNAAAYSLEHKSAKIIGFGRGAFAYHGFAHDMITGRMDSKKCCLACSKCTEIMRAGGTTGCPVRDSGVYMPIYKQYCLNTRNK
ncbi:MAG: flavin oxidoreductase/NADH oxidase [Oscillospiraceae bacterium]|nr:flavin oxidoreductase/NADH oxidase [Oscillospiraceae bacterium]